MNRSKATALLLAVLTLFPLLCLSACSGGDRSRIYDPADLLTSEEESSLQTRLNDLSAESDAQFYLATYTAEDYYDDFIGEEYCREIRNLWFEDAVLLIVTYDLSDGCYYYDMYAYRRADSVISREESDFILDHDDVYPNLKGGKVAAGAEAFFTLSAQTLEGRVVASWVSVIVGSALISMIIALLICVGVVASYKRKKASVDYPLDRYASLQLSKNSDQFVREYTTRTYSPQSSGNSSGGGGGGSRHGGGGGHRGGR